MYLELTVSDFFKSFESPRRISQFLAEGFANDNCFLACSAAEELISRKEEGIIAVIVKGAVHGGHFAINSSLVANFNFILSSAGAEFPILQAINKAISKNPTGRFWVEQAVASVVCPHQTFNDEQELTKWFLEWLKDDDQYFKNYQAPVPEHGPVIPEVVDDE